MTDRCQNGLVVTGPLEELSKFLEEVGDTFSFESIRAVPERLRGVRAESPEDIDPDEVRRGARPAENEDEFRVARWGCNGPARDVELKLHTPTQVAYASRRPADTPTSWSAS